MNFLKLDNSVTSHTLRKIWIKSKDIVLGYSYGKEYLPERKIRGCTAPITGITYLSNTHVATVSVDASNQMYFHVWNIVAGVCEKVLFDSIYTDGYKACILGISTDRVAFSSEGATVNVWNILTGTCEFIGKEHKKTVTCLLRLTDERIVSGSKDTTLKVWNINGKVCEQTLKGHSGEVTCLAGLPDGKIVSGSSDTTMKIWKLTTGLCERTLEGHTHFITCIVCLPDGRIVSGSNDHIVRGKPSGHTLRIWNTTSGLCEHIISNEEKIFSICRYGDYTVVTGNEKSLKTWDVNSGVREEYNGAHQGDILCLIQLPDGRIVSGSSDKTIKVWDLANKRSEKTLRGPVCQVYFLSEFFNNKEEKDGEEGAHIISCGFHDNFDDIQLWNVESGRCKEIISCKGMTIPKPLADGRFASCSHQLSDGSDYRSLPTDVYIWDILHGNLEHILSHKNSIEYLYQLKNGYLAVAVGNMICIWDITSGKIQQKLENTGSVSSILEVPDGRIVCSCSDGYSINIWNLQTVLCERRLFGHTEDIGVLKGLLDGRVISCSSEDRTIRIWNMDAGQCERIFHGHSVVYENQLIVLRDGYRMAFCEHQSRRGSTIQICNVNTGECELALEKAHFGTINGLIELVDGRLGSSSDDRRIKIWDIDRGICDQILRGHSNDIGSLIQLTDGRLVSGGYDETIVIWRPLKL